MTRIIDIHTHILPREIPDFKARFGYGGFILLKHKTADSADLVRDDGTFFRRVSRQCWDPEARLEDCGRHGVAIQVLSTVPVMFSYWAKPKDGLAVARHLNDEIAATVRAHPARFIGLAGLPMQSAKLAVRELERSVKELGLAGAQIGSNVNGKNLDDPGLFPVFEAAADLGAAIFIHPWDMMGQAQMPKYWLPWLVGMPAELSRAICSLIFGGVFERLPRLRVAFAHGGGSFGTTIGRIEKGFKARPDLCAVDNPVNPRKYLGRFYVDSLVHDPALLKHLLGLFGDKRVAVGSDYPFPLGEDRPGALIQSLKLRPGAKRRILSENALQWLGIKTP